jgi:tetratricopeptide (TPR) repeat protein
MLKAQLEATCLQRLGSQPAALAQCAQLAKGYYKLIDEAVHAAIQTAEQKARIESVVAQATQGKVDALESLLKEAEDRESAKGAMANPKELAKFARLRGALALARDAQDSVSDFRRSVELDPANPEGWHGLGFALVLIGDLMAAEAAIRRVFDLADAVQNPDSLAEAYATLGMLLFLRSDLDQAEAMQRKALEAFEAAGDKPGMSRAQAHAHSATRRESPTPEAGQRLTHMLLTSVLLQEQAFGCNSHGERVGRGRSSFAIRSRRWAAREDLSR